MPRSYSARRETLDPHRHRATMRWTDDEVRTLRRLAADRMPSRLIGLTLGRSELAIRVRACRERVRLSRAASP